MQQQQIDSTLSPMIGSLNGINGVFIPGGTNNPYLISDLSNAHFAVPLYDPNGLYGLFFTDSLLTPIQTQIFYSLNANQIVFRIPLTFSIMGCSITFIWNCNLQFPDVMMMLNAVNDHASQQQYGEAHSYPAEADVEDNNNNAPQQYEEAPVDFYPADAGVEGNQGQQGNQLEVALPNPAPVADLGLDDRNNMLTTLKELFLKQSTLVQDQAAIYKKVKDKKGKYLLLNVSTTKANKNPKIRETLQKLAPIEDEWFQVFPLLVEAWEALQERFPGEYPRLNVLTTEWFPTDPECITFNYAQTFHDVKNNYNSHRNIRNILNL